MSQSATKDSLTMATIPLCTLHTHSFHIYTRISAPIILEQTLWMTMSCVYLANWCSFDLTARKTIPKQREKKDRTWQKDISESHSEEWKKCNDNTHGKKVHTVRKLQKHSDGQALVKTTVDVYSICVYTSTSIWNSDQCIYQFVWLNVTPHSERYTLHTPRISFCSLATEKHLLHGKIQQQKYTLTRKTTWRRIYMATTNEKKNHQQQQQLAYILSREIRSDKECIDRANDWSNAFANRNRKKTQSNGNSNILTEREKHTARNETMRRRTLHPHDSFQTDLKIPTLTAQSFFRRFFSISYIRCISFFSCKIFTQYSGRSSQFRLGQYLGGYRQLRESVCAAFEWERKNHKQTNKQTAFACTLSFTASNELNPRWR